MHNESKGLDLVSGRLRIGGSLRLARAGGTVRWLKRSPAVPACRMDDVLAQQLMHSSKNLLMPVAGLCVAPSVRRRRAAQPACHSPGPVRLRTALIQFYTKTFNFTQKRPLNRKASRCLILYIDIPIPVSRYSYDLKSRWTT